jgi:hypothetical protein
VNAETQVAIVGGLADTREVLKRAVGEQLLDDLTGPTPDAVAVPFELRKDDGTELTPAQRDEVVQALSKAMNSANGKLSSDKVVNRRLVKVRAIGEDEDYVQTNVTVDWCRHQINPSEHPKHVNCSSCWSFYFKLHPGVVMAAERVLQTIGPAALVQSHGRKFAKHVRRYIGLTDTTGSNGSNSAAV